MSDLLSVVQTELSGPRAANYSALSDADAATALQNSGQVYQDVTVGAVEGYLRGKGIVTAFEDWLNGATPPIGMAKVAVRELLGLITGKVASFELSDPVKFAEIKGMMDAIVAGGGSPFTAQNETDVLAFGKPYISAQIVIAARIINASDVVAAPGQPNITPYTNYTWTRSVPQTAIKGQAQINGNALVGTQNGNIYVLITVDNSATQERWVGWVSGNSITKSDIVKQAALMIASYQQRDEALAGLN